MVRYSRMYGMCGTNRVSMLHGAVPGGCVEQPSTVSYSELLLCVCTSLRVGLVGQAVGLWATEQVLGKFLILRGPRGASEGRLFLFQEGLEWLPYSVVSVESSEQASGGGGIFGPRQSSQGQVQEVQVTRVHRRRRAPLQGQGRRSSLHNSCLPAVCISSPSADSSRQ